MSRGPRTRWLVAVVAVVVVAGLVVSVVVLGVPSPRQLQADLTGLGDWAPVVFGSLYAAVSLSPLPKTAFTVVAGALFGVPLGLSVVVVGATIGALLAFSLTRRLGRDAVGARAAKRPRAAAAYARSTALLERRGFLAVLVLRLIPFVPFTALNYLSGLSAVRVRDFLLGTVVGILPATIAYVTVGAYGTRPGSWPFIAGLLTLAGLSLVGLVAAGVRRRA